MFLAIFDIYYVFFRVIANYVAWRMVTDTYIAMPQSARDLQSDYNKVIKCGCCFDGITFRMNRFNDIYI